MQRHNYLSAVAIASALLLSAGCASKLDKPPVPESSAPKRTINDFRAGDTSSAARRLIAISQQYAQEGRPDKALESALAARKDSPQSAEVVTMVALAYEANQQSDQAQSMFDEALKLAPRDGAVQNAYGAWLCGKKRYPEAEQYFRSAITDPRYPTPEQSVANAGLCALRAGEPAKAERYLRLVLRDRPKDPTTLSGLAEATFKQGDYFSARAFLQRRDALGPMNPGLLRLGSQIEDALGDRRAADGYRQRLQTEYPDLMEKESSAADPTPAAALAAPPAADTASSPTTPAPVVELPATTAPALATPASTASDPAKPRPAATPMSPDASAQLTTPAASQTAPLPASSDAAAVPSTVLPAIESTEPALPEATQTNKKTGED